MIKKDDLKLDGKVFIPEWGPDICPECGSKIRCFYYPNSVRTFCANAWHDSKERKASTKEAERAVSLD